MFISIVVVNVARLGDFWKFLAKRILTKVAQMIGNFQGNLEKPHCCYFLGNFLLQHLVTVD